MILVPDHFFLDSVSKSHYFRSLTQFLTNMLSEKTRYGPYISKKDQFHHGTKIVAQGI